MVQQFPWRKCFIQVKIQTSISSETSKIFFASHSNSDVEAENFTNNSNLLRCVSRDSQMRHYWFKDYDGVSGGVLGIVVKS